VKELASQLKVLNNDLIAKQSGISELLSKIAQLRNSDNINEYNNQVPIYTTLTTIYNRRLASYMQSIPIMKDIQRSVIISPNISSTGKAYDYMEKNMPG
jgi:hypothetical protein